VYLSKCQVQVCSKYRQDDLHSSVMNAGGCIRIAAGRKVLFSFQEDTILFYHKILTMKTAFDIGHTVAVNYKARKEQ
jgi:hypothetical protein